LSCRVPLAIVLGQMVLVGLWLGLTDRLAPVILNDTPTYTDYPWHSWRLALDDIRTPAYPALLRLTRLLWDDHAGDPTVHYLLYCGGVWLFFGGTAAYLNQPVAAAVAASSLLYSRILHGYVMTIATDTVAAAGGIAVCGATLWWLARPGWAMAAAVVLTTIVGWMIRPANLFLAAFVPVATWLLPRRTPEGDRPARRRDVLFALVMTLVPLLAYCTFRYAAIGRFAVVSHGGYNLIGVAGQFLSADDLDRLSVESRPLAAGALARRAADDRPRTPYDELPRLNYMRMEMRYDITIWSEFVPAAREQEGNHWGPVNAALRRLSLELLRLHPGEYAVWLAKATRQAAKKVLWDFADNPVTLALLLLAVLNVCQPGFLTPAAPVAGERKLHAAVVLLVVAAAYLVLALAVVIPVCPPLGRMTDATAVLLAAPLAVWLLPGRDRPPSGLPTS
jgi:hypothetical protein